MRDGSRAAAADRAAVTLSGLFDAEDRHVRFVELPLSAEEMVAALYGAHHYLTAADLRADRELWLHAAIGAIEQGLSTISAQAAQIRAAECSPGGVAAPEWLALCRRRVAEVTGDARACPTRTG